MGARSQWTTHSAAQALAEKARDLGRVPRVADCERSTPSCPSATVVRRLFGSWNKGLIAAGLGSGIARHVDPSRNGWSDDEITDAIRRWAAVHGDPPVSRDWTRAGASQRVGIAVGPKVDQEVDRWPLSSLVIRRFGTWSAAIEAAGVTPRSRRYAQRWPRSTILALVNEWANATGEVPTTTVWDGLPRSEYPSTVVVRRRFGSWDAFLQAAGLTRSSETQRLVEQITVHPGVTLDEIVNGSSLSAGSVRALLSGQVRAGSITRTREESTVRFWPA